MPAQGSGVNPETPRNRGDDLTMASAESNSAPGLADGNTAQLEDSTSYVAGDICPSCGSSALVYEEGCSKCYACGHSEC